MEGLAKHLIRGTLGGLAVKLINGSPLLLLCWQSRQLGRSDELKSEPKNASHSWSNVLWAGAKPVQSLALKTCPRRYHPGILRISCIELHRLPEITMATVLVAMPIAIPTIGLSCTNSCTTSVAPILSPCLIPILSYQYSFTHNYFIPIKLY